MRNEKKRFASRQKHKPTVGEKVMAKESKERNLTLNDEPAEEPIKTFMGGQI